MSNVYHPLMTALVVKAESCNATMQMSGQSSCRHTVPLQAFDWLRCLHDADPFIVVASLALCPSPRPSNLTNIHYNKAILSHSIAKGRRADHPKRFTDVCDVVDLASLGRAWLHFANLESR
jgi:hypothetical protein